MRLGGKWPQMTRELELPLANRTGKRSEEEPPAMHENERSGARISTSWVSPGWPRNLNFSNRPVRTRMPGGVAGVPADLAGPLCRSNRWADAIAGSCGRSVRTRSVGDRE